MFRITQDLIQSEQKTPAKLSNGGRSSEIEGPGPGNSRETGRIGDRTIRSRGRFRSGGAARRSGARISPPACADQKGTGTASARR